MSQIDEIVENESEAINIPKLFTKNVVTSMIQILSKIETSTEEESIVLAVLERIISKAKDEKQILKPILKNTLKKITSSKKIEDADEELEPSSLVDMLRSLIDLSNSSSALVNELSQPIPLYAECCTLILKFAQKLNDKRIDDEILGLYQSSLKTFFNKT